MALHITATGGRRAVHPASSPAPRSSVDDSIRGGAAGSPARSIIGRLLRGSGAAGRESRINDHVLPLRDKESLIRQLTVEELSNAKNAFNLLDTLKQGSVEIRSLLRTLGMSQPELDPVALEREVERIREIRRPVLDSQEFIWWFALNQRGPNRVDVGRMRYLLGAGPAAALGSYLHRVRGGGCAAPRPAGGGYNRMHRVCHRRRATTMVSSTSKPTPR